MMEIHLKLVCLTSLVILFLLIQEGYSIKCWDCRSDLDPKCSDPFENKTFAITDCEQISHLNIDNQGEVKATMCRKIRQKVHGVWRYIRSCAFLGEPGIQGDERFCLMRTGTYNIFMEYCTCNTKDGCNTSSHLRISRMLFLSPLLALVFYKIFR